MLSKQFMTHFGVGLAPITIVLLDTLFVGPGSGNALVDAFRSSGATPFIAWTVALFVGHWFHPVDSLKPGFGVVGFPWNYIIFGTLTLLVAVLSFWVIDTDATSDWLPLAMVLLGYAVGAIFWPVGLERGD